MLTVVIAKVDEDVISFARIWLEIKGLHGAEEVMWSYLFGGTWQLLIILLDLYSSYMFTIIINLQSICVILSVCPLSVEEASLLCCSSKRFFLGSKDTGYHLLYRL